jgi:UDP-N-acetylglucosamine:LPS N-acetylglucosamine transferase
MSHTAVTKILAELGLTIQASAANSILQKLELKISVNKHCYSSELCLTIKFGLGLLTAIHSLSYCFGSIRWGVFHVLGNYAANAYAEAGVPCLKPV